MLEQNESDLDKKVRLIVGAVSLLLALFVFSGFLKILFLVVGILGIFTGLTGFCLLYKLFGISTKK